MRCDYNCNISVNIKTVYYSAAGSGCEIQIYAEVIPTIYELSSL